MFETICDCFGSASIIFSRSLLLNVIDILSVYFDLDCMFIVCMCVCVYFAIKYFKEMSEKCFQRKIFLTFGYHNFDHLCALIWPTVLAL